MNILADSPSGIILVDVGHGVGPGTFCAFRSSKVPLHEVDGVLSGIWG